MMRFFRKHNRKLIAILMALLMVVFVGGSALEGMLTPRVDRVVAESRLGPISYLDQQTANRTTELLGSLGMDWQQPVGIGGPPLEKVDWILLTREADDLGSTVDESYVRSTVSNDQINIFARLRRVRPDAVIEAIRQFQSVQQTALMVGAAAAPSEAELLEAARNALETVRVNAVVLPAAAMIDDDAPITPAERTTQFEAYRDKERGSGLTFGYYMHPAIKVQFLQIRRDKIAEQVGIANLAKKARRYFDDERQTDPVFRRPADEIHRDPTGMGPEQDPYLRWSDAEALATEAVRKQEADRRAARIANWLIDYAAAGFADVERGDSGYRAAPESIANIDFYRRTLELVPDELRFEGAVNTWESNLFTLAEASDVSMIGSAQYRPERGVPIPFADLAFRTEPIVPKVPTDKGADPSSYISLYQTCPYPVSDLSGNMYVFRVVAARAGRPAASIDEVAEQIDKDIRLQRAYELATAQADDLVGCLGVKNLREAYESNAELVALRDTAEGQDSGYVEPPPFARVPAGQAARGRGDLGVVVGGGVGLIPNEAVDRCFALEREIEKADVLELRDRAAVLVVEWVETTPPEELRFSEERSQILNQLTNLRWADALGDWLDPEQVRARNGFKLVGSEP